MPALLMEAVAQDGKTRRQAPLVTTVIPAYNAAAHIRRAVDSVLAQTWPHLEVIVVDDGSRDQTLRVLAGYGNRLRVVTQSNQGPAAARNRGLALSNGEFVAFLDADDWWLPGKISAQVALMQERPDLGFCSTATQIVDGAGRRVGLWPCKAADEPLPDLLFTNGAAISGSTSGVLARKALVLEVGGFDESLRGFEDPDLWIRLSARTGYACLPEPLTVVVRTPGSVSSNLAAMRKATLASLRKNRPLLPARRRGAFWRSACAGALTDYAKSAWRCGRRAQALAWTLEALVRSPVGRGRLALGLLMDMLRGRLV